jgi:hypothetical protein
MTRRFRRSFASLAFALVSGCAHDAPYCSLEVRLPDEGYSHARVRVALGPNAVDATDIRAIADVPRPWRIAVEGTDVAAADGTALDVTIELCADHACATDPLEHVRVVERAFYVGERTRVALEVASAAPPSEIIVDRCEVLGCGAPAESLGACDVDGVHACE